MSDGGAPAPGPDDGGPRDADRRARRVREILGASAAPVVAPGDTVGRYRIVRPLGAGAMGVVWLGRDDVRAIDAAIKLISPRHAADEAAAQRFVREAAAAARLHHPSIVRVIESGVSGAMRFIAFEFVRGPTAEQVLDELHGLRPEQVTDGDVAALLRGDSPDHRESGADATNRRRADAGGAWFRRVATWGTELAAALDHAHARGILHRDVKPSNILIDADGRARLTDFGLAHLEDGLALSRSDAIVGSLGYLPPEGIERAGRPIDARADIYALGATLYELASLQRMRTSASVMDIVASIRDSGPPSVVRRAPAIPGGLAAVIDRCVRRDREDRYATAQDLCDDLRRFLAGEPVRGAMRPGRPPWSERRRAATLTAAALLVVMAVGASSGASGWAARARATEAREHAAESRRIAEQRTDELASLCQQLDGLSDLRVREDDRSRAILAERRATVEARIARLRTDIARAEAETDSHLLHAIAAEAESGSVSDVTRDAVLSYAVPRRERALRELRTADAARFAELAAQVGAPPYGAPGSLRLLDLPAAAGVHLFRRRPVAANADRAETPRDVWAPCRADGSLLPAAPLGECAPHDRCLEITHVEPGGFAAAAGLAAGDLVLCLDGATPSRMFVASTRPGGPAAALRLPGWTRIAAVDGHPIEDPADWRRELHVPEPPGRRELATESGAVSVPGVAGDPDPFGVTVARARSLLSSEAPPRSVRLTCLRRDQVVSLELPAHTRFGATCVGTATPLLTPPGSRLAPGTERMDLPPGSYLVLVREPGAADRRFAVRVWSDAERRVSVGPAPDVAPPPDAVVVPAGESLLGGRTQRFGDDPAASPVVERSVPAFVIRRFETTVGEYFEFLNDPAVRGTIDTSGDPSRAPSGEPRRLVPRTPGSRGLLARRTPDGRWVPDRADDAPVVGVSFDDVREFIAWKNARAAAAGSPWRFRLPRQEEWERAARGADGRRYPWGDRFDPTLCLAQTSEPDTPADLEVGFATPDESPWGVRDLGGSVSEWVDGHLIFGGNWADCDTEIFRAANCRSISESTCSPQIGFRLVLERE